MIWRLTYCNKKGVEARVDIIQGDRTPVEIVEGSGNPFIMSYRLDKTDKSGHIMTSSADIEIFETETFNIDDLKTSNETELKVEYFEENVLTWAGFILPDFFSREVGSPNIVRMTASDRLTALKGITLSDLPTKVSLRNLIELSLAQTGLSLSLASQIDISQGSTNILNSEILSQRLTDVRGRSINCYDILMSIMVGTNSTIRQRAGQWQVYNKLEHELRTPTIFFDKVERGAIRTIQPVASSVGVYNEFGGNNIYPENYDFSDGLTGWTTVNGFSAGLNNKEVTGYTMSGGDFFPIYGDSVETNSVINRNAAFSTSSSPYLKSENIGVSYPDNDSVDVTVEVNATGVGSFITNSFVEFAIIATNTVTSKTLSLSSGGIFETMTNTPHIHRIKFPTVTSFYNASNGSLQVKGVLTGGNENLGDYHIHIRIYGSGGGRTSFINSATIKFSVGGDNPKGNLYKTTQGSNFTKQHDIETVIFGDYIATGLNGYFYNYPIDDTSNLYLPSGELSSPVWKTVFDPTERPLLHHVSRQKSRLFSVAHDILKANINVESFDPLAVFQDCRNRKYIAISASFDFLRSEVDVELEQIAYDDTILKRDFIYSYFGEGEDTIKSIGGIAGGGGAGGGSSTPQYWTLDENGNLKTEYNAYSTKGLSALGLGEDGGGGGGGSDYERLDTWASYDSSRAGWVLSAFLGNDLNTRVTNLENSAGGGGSTVEWGTLTNGYRQLTVEGVTYGLAQNTHKHLWADITDKPSTFTPSAHTHSKSQITDFSHTHLWADITDKPSTFTPSAHTHLWADITDKPSTFAPSAHTHSASDISSGTFAIARIPTGTTGTTVALGNHLHTGVYEPVFTKNTAFNKNFGTALGTVAQGNDSRINNGQTAYGWGNHATAGYEPVFSKNTAFNKNFGTTSGTVAQGNDSRINNGQTAYGWGNHATAGYTLNSALSNYLPLTGGTLSGDLALPNLTAGTSVKAPKVSIGDNWTLELSGTELVFKYNGEVKQRMLSDGTILGTGGVTALVTN